MSTWDKLLDSFRKLDRNIRFDEIRQVLESYGYTMCQPHGGSSHYTFRKPDRGHITIPYKKPVKLIYVKLVRDIIEEEEDEK